MKALSVAALFLSSSLLALPPFPPPTQRPQPLTPQQPFPKEIGFTFCYGQKPHTDNIRKTTVQLTISQSGIYGSEAVGQLVQTFWLPDHDIPSAINTAVVLSPGRSLDGKLSYRARFNKAVALDWNKILDEVTLKFDGARIAAQGKLLLGLNGSREEWDMNCQSSTYVPR